MVPSQMSPWLRVTRDLFKFFTWPGLLAANQLSLSLTLNTAKHLAYVWHNLQAPRISIP